ncbi:hypothetical protein NSED_03325 [Candidatus Nitrosopumilus sediminis]|uniref:Uncharacterized protein n=1 Tax=Candidatus Nitrosopumilus sediminis TaxID=1229909 RepID=K0BDR9_9ARCH|nr:hypothetical protein NSED_03325 [Candidatus Nitrosopumilus sediminis]
MFLPWKLIFQKINLKYLALFLFGGLFLLGVLVLTNNTCNIEYVILSNEIRSYEKSLDPEFCENTLEKINLYNDQCPSQIEILDCG